jgi:hypothetical protein
MDNKTLYSKLAIVPRPIKIWLGSDPIIDYVNGMDDTFTLPRETSSVIKKILQEFITKGISPDYFSGELASELNLEKDKATHITAEIKKNVLFPIKQELTTYGINIDLLDKFQMPTAKPFVGDAPKMFQDIGPSVASLDSIKPAPLPVNKMAPPPGMAATIPAGTPVAIPGFAPKPSKLSDVGWSKKQSVGPVVKLDISQASPTTPAAISSVPQSSIVAPHPSAPAMNNTMGEFERLNLMKKAPGWVPTPITEPAPMILHEDTSFRAVVQNIGFRLSKPGEGAEIPMIPGSSPQAPARAAILELGNLDPTIPKPPTPPTKVVHYTEFQTSLSSVPTTTSGPRNISQVTPLPMPPKPPTPPSPSSIPQVEKVIVKDFL